MTPITDFDPLKMLEDLQAGFVTMAEAHHALTRSQSQLIEQIHSLWAVIQRQQAQIDLLAQHTGLSDNSAKK